MTTGGKITQRIIGAVAAGSVMGAFWLIANTPSGTAFEALPGAAQVSSVGFFVGLILFGVAILLWGGE